MMQMDGLPLSTVMSTVEPIGTTAPPAGLWSRTSSGLMHASLNFVLGTRPAAVMMSSAWLRRCPRTSGTVADVAVQVTDTSLEVARTSNGGNTLLSLAMTETNAIYVCWVGDLWVTPPVQMVPSTQLPICPMGVSSKIWTMNGVRPTFMLEVAVRMVVLPAGRLVGAAVRVIVSQLTTTFADWRRTSGGGTVLPSPAT
jgi:hypothetical protein